VTAGPVERRHPERSAGPRPIDRLFAAYAAAAGAALLFPQRPAAWPLLAALHIAAIVVLLRLGPAGRLVHGAHRRWPRAAVLLGDWYPLLLMPLLYAELAILNLAVWDGRYFDDLVLGWEERLFGGQPSREWAAALPNLILSELLHLSYISYYFIIYGPPAILYAAGRRPEFRYTVFVVMLVFFAHYLFFIYFPVQGPRYLFPPPGGALADGPIYSLTHRLLEAGSSQGAAFPSSHVGVAVAQTALALRRLPRLAPVLALLTAGLAAGAIYGGFHYATDAAAGLALGLLLAAVAPALWRRLT
jgi:membrane-associated phospholipid phosphatase